MDYYSVVEKISNAVETLAKSNKLLKERIIEACPDVMMPDGDELRPDHKAALDAVQGECASIIEETSIEKMQRFVDHLLNFHDTLLTEENNDE